MFKNLITFLLITIGTSLNGQSIELSSGMLINTFYDWEETYPRDVGRYSSGSDFFISFGCRQMNLDGLQVGCTLTYERYGGELYAYSGGNGGGTTTEAIVQKSLFSLGLFPFDRRIYKQLNVHLGLVYSIRISESYSGTYKGNYVFDSTLNFEQDLNEKYDSFNASSYLGAVAGVAYDIALTESLSLSPQYSTYIGLSDEIGVSEYQRNMRSMRHYFGLGLKKKI